MLRKSTNLAGLIAAEAARVARVSAQPAAAAVGSPAYSTVATAPTQGAPTGDALGAHLDDTDNPHATTAAQVGVSPYLLALSGAGAGKVLAVAAGGAALEWIAAGMVNPMTTAGDLIIGGTAGAPARLAVGTSGQVLKGGTAPAWGALTTADVSEHASRLYYTDARVRAAISGTGAIVVNPSTGVISVWPSLMAHNDLASLTTGDPHTQYPLLAGRAGGQTLYGGTDASEELDLVSTANATKGWLKFLGTGLLGRNQDGDATTHIMRLATLHYTQGATPEEHVTLAQCSAQASSNLVTIGGGISNQNAATQISLYTAPDTTTLTGTERLRIDSVGNVVPGTAALATDATAGFLYLQSCAGAPTGTPTAHTGRCACVVDTSNLRLYVRVGSAWRYAALT